jgi:hypothetical protein
MAKTSYETIIGQVVSAEIKTRAPYDKYIGRYSPNTSFLEFYAEFAVRTETDTVYFKSPGIIRRATNGGPVCVVTYSKSETDFMREVGENKVAEAGKPNDNVLVLKINIGDRIELTGRVKAAAVSRKGNAYRTLTHVSARVLENS